MDEKISCIINEVYQKNKLPQISSKINIQKIAM